MRKIINKFSNKLLSLRREIGSKIVKICGNYSKTTHAHTAKSTKRFLEKEHIDVVEDWPTKGDDINPIENLWAILDERLEEKKFKTKKGMKKAIMGIWEKVDQQLLHNLVSSVPDRLRRIIKAKGGSIKRVH